MANHPNERTEMYCRQRARGCLPAKAAIIAGYASGSAIYSKLEEDPTVLARIAELMQENEAKRASQLAAARESGKKIGELVGVGHAWVIQQLAENAQLARMDGCFKESNDALKLIGDHFGMFKGNGEESDDNAGNIPQHLDLDALKQITDQASETLPEILRDPEADAERALRLIGGARINPKSRELSTGSETDVAFTPAAEPEPDTE